MNRNFTFTRKGLKITGHLYIPEDYRRAGLAPPSSPIMRYLPMGKFGETYAGVVGDQAGLVDVGRLRFGWR